MHVCIHISLAIKIIVSLLYTYVVSRCHGSYRNPKTPSNFSDVENVRAAFKRCCFIVFTQRILAKHFAPSSGHMEIGISGMLNICFRCRPPKLLKECWDSDTVNLFVFLDFRPRQELIHRRLVRIFPGRRISRYTFNWPLQNLTLNIFNAFLHMFVPQVRGGRPRCLPLATPLLIKPLG